MSLMHYHRQQRAHGPQPPPLSSSATHPQPPHRLPKTHWRRSPPHQPRQKKNAGNVWALAAHHLSRRRTQKHGYYKPDEPTPGTEQQQPQSQGEPGNPQQKVPQPPQHPAQPGHKGRTQGQAQQLEKTKRQMSATCREHPEDPPEQQGHQP
ncbi:activating signal cointegrator 1 complex subunit 2 homolog [Procambarus clarkii]|uniref:activating signal cointegrator 1 complex subunit 2 homolog n=1 Tax=Procambarus clarkii TaxID=6728 RepID=UPI0037436957